MDGVTLLLPSIDFILFMVIKLFLLYPEKGFGGITEDLPYEDTEEKLEVMVSG